MYNELTRSYCRCGLLVCCSMPLIPGILFNIWSPVLRTRDCNITKECLNGDRFYKTRFYLARS